MYSIKVIPHYSELDIFSEEIQNEEEARRGFDYYKYSSLPYDTFEIYMDYHDETVRNAIIKPCAYINLILVCDLTSSKEIMTIADDINSYSYDAFRALFNSKEYKNPSDLEMIPYSGILDTLYVMPDFRNKGIASFLKRHLSDILFNGTRRISLNSIITLPGPFAPGTEIKDGEGYVIAGEYSGDEQQLENIKKQIRRNLKINGFRKMTACSEEGEHFWIKQYTDRPNSANYEKTRN